MFEPLLAYLIVLLASITRSSGEKSILRIPSLLDRIEATEKSSKMRFFAYSFISRTLILLLSSVFIGIIVDLFLEVRYEFLPQAAGFLSSIWGGYMLYHANLQRKKLRGVLYSDTGFKYMEPRYQELAEYEGPIVGTLASFSKSFAEKGKVVMYWGIITGILSIINMGIVEFAFSVAYVATLIPNIYPIALAMSASFFYSIGAILPMYFVVKALGGIEKRLPVYVKLNKLKFGCSLGVFVCGILLIILPLV